MPLCENAEKGIRKNLQYIRNGRKAHPVVIGHLTDVQLGKMNEERAGRGFPAMGSTVLFVGQHVYNSRITQDGYSVDDVIAQITSAMNEDSVFHVNPKMNSVVNAKAREDGYGNSVFDEAVFECSVRYPFPELFSVIPKGDKIKPKDAPKKNMGRANAAHIQNSANPSG
jgi:hypothetical protein